MEYLQKAVENDERNVFAAVDLLKAYMKNIPTHKTKMEQLFSNPLHKVGKHFAEILILKAVFEYLNGNTQKAVDLLIQAVTNSAKSVDTLEVPCQSYVVIPFTNSSHFNRECILTSNAAIGVTTIHFPVK